MNKFILLLLIFFPETSIQTSLALEKDSIHSIYLYRIMSFTYADLLLLVSLISIILNFLIRKRIKFNIGIVKPLLVTYLIYFIIGIAYNIFVHFNINGLLYDLKATLYLFVPYFTLKTFYNDISITKKRIYLVFIIAGAGSIYDAVYVNSFAGAEYPSLLNFPVIQSLIPIQFLVAWLFTFGIGWNVISLGFEFISAYNRANLGQISSFFIATIIVIILNKLIYFRRKAFILSSSLVYYIFFVLIPLVLLYYGGLYTDLKTDGFLIRLSEIESFKNNFFNNIPGIIGKGLGATWFETHSTGYENEYSFGSKFTEGNVRFIWHNTLAGHFYKLGILGSIITIFFSTNLVWRLFRLYRSTGDLTILFIALSYFIYGILNVSGVGVLKGALLTSLLLFAADALLNEKKKSQ